ncbi:hypothetical protein BX616_007141 [Lobosporangium transversale]|uniref:Uncharacterized protein n=1 Tax=Lobosporangium transversale TaxID=64571 RepID=A0A1Y2GTG6_9FUNG|nr:hypothetical protein BCR41DRAFT_394793 [Lobosporangium transversale]KAF9896597.1 hypothetical protein BX616_007141 [Lobosporangium transversale]ORZ20882.1 hypothetical protein BCR41DRAFT_394793 [Lobosporangium transversale]|eukprot:XP_021882791.1 hypothetical protein BCR41DRAFT_394793 [Lobosporangium transversale]
MHKSLLLLALCAAGALAQGDYHVDITNSAGWTRTFYEYSGYRACYCLINTQTAKIYNRDVGDVKLFSSTDCTGSYTPLAKGKTQYNAQWVDSMSFGKSGIPSRDPTSCPNYFS